MPISLRSCLLQASCGDTPVIQYLGDGEKRLKFSSKTSLKQYSKSEDDLDLLHEALPKTKRTKILDYPKLTMNAS